jgi:hypothetical protein
VGRKNQAYRRCRGAWKVTNPYSVRGMIKDADAFYGREKELKRIYTRLAALQSCSVVGPRRIGKSSLLYHLAIPSTYSLYLDNHESYVFAFINLQELAGLSSDDFLFAAVERLCQASGGRLKTTPSEQIGHKGFLRFLTEAEDAGLQLVLCCDEFEALSHNLQCDVNFFTYFRGVLASRNLALVTSSRVSLFELCHRDKVPTSQFWNIFTEFALGLMPESEAKRLISEPFAREDVIITENEINFALDLAGSHPFFLQIVSFHLFEAKSLSAPINFSEIEHLFFSEACQHYAFAWEQLDAKEQARLVSFLRLQQPIQLNSFRSLERRALVTGQPDAPRWVSSGWKRFVESQAPSDPGLLLAQISEPAGPSNFLQRTLMRPPRSWMQATAEVLKLQLIALNGLEFEVWVLESPMGQFREVSRLPYDFRALVAVLKALQVPASDTYRFTKEQYDALTRLGLLRDDSVVPNILQHVGERLYAALMIGKIRLAFTVALAQARYARRSVALQLRFDEDAVELARYPWELIHDSNFHLLPSKAVELTRYISHPTPTVALTGSPPLRLLYLAPRPKDLPPLPSDEEQRSIRQALSALERRKMLKLYELSHPTYEALLDYIEEQPVDILHFDGHGAFARRCPQCRVLNPPHLDRCTHCRTGLEEISPEGHLAFEYSSPDRDARWVSSTTLGTLLFGSSLRLVVLSACSSGMVLGKTLFDGIGPALIRAGVPAVVATQLSISVPAAASFASSFYRALANSKSIPAAVNAGRIRLFDGREWFIPTLYLRSKDDRGCLFAWQV